MKKKRRAAVAVGITGLILVAVASLWLFHESSWKSPGGLAFVNKALTPPRAVAEARSLVTPVVKQTISGDVPSERARGGKDAVVLEFKNSEFATTEAYKLYEAAKVSTDPAAIEAGYFAAQRCALINIQLDHQMSVQAEDQERFEAARTVLRQYCAGFKGESAHDLSDIARNGAARGSKLLEIEALQLEAARNDALSVGEDSRLCGWLLSSKQNPEILRSLIPTLVAGTRETLFGQPYGNRNRARFMGALELAACELGSPCNAAAWEGIRPCGLDGFCDVENTAKSIVQYESTPEDRAALVALANLVVSEVRAGRCEEVITARYR